MSEQFFSNLLDKYHYGKSNIHIIYDMESRLVDEYDELLSRIFIAMESGGSGFFVAFKRLLDLDTNVYSKTHKVKIFTWILKSNNMFGFFPALNDITYSKNAGQLLSYIEFINTHKQEIGEYLLDRNQITSISYSDMYIEQHLKLIQYRKVDKEVIKILFENHCIGIWPLYDLPVETGIVPKENIMYRVQSSSPSEFNGYVVAHIINKLLGTDGVVLNYSIEADYTMNMAVYFYDLERYQRVVDNGVCFKDDPHNDVKFISLNLYTINALIKFINRFSDGDTTAVDILLYKISSRNTIDLVEIVKDKFYKTNFTLTPDIINVKSASKEFIYTRPSFTIGNREIGKETFNRTLSQILDIANNT